MGIYFQYHDPNFYPNSRNQIISAYQIKSLSLFHILPTNTEYIPHDSLSGNLSVLISLSAEKILLSDMCYVIA